MLLTDTIENFVSHSTWTFLLINELDIIDALIKCTSMSYQNNTSNFCYPELYKKKKLSSSSV